MLKSYIRLGEYSPVGLQFLAPDASGSSGGSSGAGSGGGQQGGGGQGGGADTELDIKLFDSLPWDELDDDSKAALTKIKNASVATLQKTARLAGEVQTQSELARRFQSEKDRFEAELKKRGQGGQGGQGGGEGGGGTQDDPYLTAITEELLGAGYDNENAKKLAPVFGSMFKRIGGIQAKELSKSLAPMANSVLAGQANDAYLTALSQDPLGMFQDEQVSQTVWDFVKERVAAGVETTPEIVLNLGKMAWADREAAKRAGDTGAGAGGGAGGGNGDSQGGGGGGGGAARGALSATPPNMRTGGMPFLMGGAQPPGRVADPNAPKHVLNDDTRNALASTFKTMTAGTKIVPTELRDTMQKGARR